jgi:hypothetical protein
MDSDISSYNFRAISPGLWLNQEVFPRAFFVGRCRAFKDIDHMMRYALSPSFQPSHEVLLFESDCREGPAAEGSCVLRSETDNGQRYSADCTVGTEGGWIFFSVMQYPGWKATVNQRPAELIRADIAFYAVPLRPGRHDVELTYRSAGLFYGSWIAAAGSGVLAVWFAWRPRWSYRRGAG